MTTAAPSFEFQTTYHYFSDATPWYEDLMSHTTLREKDSVHHLDIQVDQ